MAKLRRLAGRSGEVQVRLAELGNDDPDSAKADAPDALIVADRALTADAPVRYAEATQAVGILFRILGPDPDGRVRRAYRIPSCPASRGQRQRRWRQRDGRVRPDDLRESQLAKTFTHQAPGPAGRRRWVLAMVLHVHDEALAVRHEASGATLHVVHMGERRQRRAELDPFHGRPFVTDADAYATLAALPDAQVEALIDDLLTVERVTAHLQQRTELVGRLASEPDVDVRKLWRPDAAWLAGYLKAQLVHLAYALRGPAAKRKRKTELIAKLDQRFSDAADALLAERLNAWPPANLRQADGRPAAQANAA